MDEIEQLVIPDAGQQFTGDDFRMLTKPGVYVFMQNGKALYVGVSDTLIQRAAAKHHRQADRARVECDKVLLYPCVSLEAASKLEILLIHRLKPRYNINHRLTYVRQRLGLDQNPKIG